MPLLYNLLWFFILFPLFKVHCKNYNFTEFFSFFTRLFFITDFPRKMKIKLNKLNKTEKLYFLFMYFFKYDENLYNL